MPGSRIPSPARSQGVISTPRRHKSRRRTRSVSSPAPSNMYVRLSTLVTDAFKVSPMPNRRSVLTDETDIEIQPGRKSWWKRLGENSREIMDVLESKDNNEIKNVADEFDVEVLSQEKRNFSLDLPESSDGESISSIVIPQRKLFTQKHNNPQMKFAQINNNRDSQKRKSHNEPVKDIEIAPKNLFSQPKQRNKPVFPSGLLNISANKTLNKTKEMPAPEVKGQVRSLFGNRPATKRKNMFADFIVSDSEDDIPDIQPKVFAFKKKVEERRRESTNSKAFHHSPTSSIDLEMDDWKLLPSSTMVGNQLEDTTPVKRARLSKLSEVKESETASTINKTVNNTKQSNKSMETKNKSKMLSNSKLKETEILVHQDAKEDDDLSNSRTTRNKSKLMRENSLVKANRSKVSNVSKNITIKDKNATNNKNPENIQQNNSEENIKSVRNISLEQNQDEIENNDNEDFTLEYENDDENVEDAEIDVGGNNKLKNKNDIVTKLHNKIDDIKEKEREPKILNNSSNKTINKSYKHDKDMVDGDAAEKVLESDKQNVVKHSKIINANTQNVNDSVNISQHHKSYRHNNKENTSLSSENKIPKGNRTREQHSQHSLDEDDNALEPENENQDDEDEKVDEINDKMDTEESVEDNESENENQAECQEIQDESEEQNEQIDSEQELDESDTQNKTEDKEDMEVDHEQENESKDEDRDSSKEVQDDEESNNDISVNQPDEDEEELNESEKENNESMMNEEHQTEIDESENEQTENNDDEQTDSKNETGNNDDEPNISDIEENEDDDDEQVDNDQNEEQNESQHEDNDTDNNEANTGNHESPNISNERNENLGVTSPEAILHDKTNQIESFTAIGSNTTARKTKSILIKNLNIRPSLAPVRESTGFSDGTTNSSADNSGWDSHRTTRKTLRQTFGKDFTLRKSLRALVMEKSAKRHTNFLEKADLTEVDNTKAPQANSTEFPHFESYEEDPMHVDETPEEVSEERDGEQEDNKEPEAPEESGEHEELEEPEELEETEEHEELEEPEELEETEEHEELENPEELEETEEHEELEEPDNHEELEEAEGYEEPEEPDEYLQPGDSEELDEPEEQKDIEESKRKKQTTLEMYLQKIKQENLEKKRKMEEQVRNSLKTTQQYNPFKIPRKPVPRIKTIEKGKKKEKSRLLHLLPAEVIEDMKYKPPKRFQPNNASWITKRLYKFLETKLEPKYDYKARIRAEKLVETIYNFAKDVKKHDIAPSHSVDVLKSEMARLDVVKTHFDFYEFFHNYMPREIRIKVVPDVVNKISLPKHGVFAEIIR